MLHNARRPIWGHIVLGTLPLVVGLAAIYPVDIEGNEDIVVQQLLVNLPMAALVVRRRRDILGSKINSAVGILWTSRPEIVHR